MPFELKEVLRARQGESFRAGGRRSELHPGRESYTLQRLLTELAAVTGLPEARRRVPRSLSLGVAHLSELGGLLRRHPSVPLEAAGMSTTQLASDARARTELSCQPRPAADAIESSARWFADNGYVKPSRRGRIGWHLPS